MNARTDPPADCPFDDLPQWWLDFSNRQALQQAAADPGPLPEAGYSTDAAGTFTGEDE